MSNVSSEQMYGHLRPVFASLPALRHPEVNPCASRGPSNPLRSPQWWCQALSSDVFFGRKQTFRLGIHTGLVWELGLPREAQGSQAQQLSYGTTEHFEFGLQDAPCFFPLDIAFCEGD